VNKVIVYGVSSVRTAYMHKWRHKSQHPDTIIKSLARPDCHLSVGKDVLLSVFKILN
jgi:hypothetical protein